MGESKPEPWIFKYLVQIIIVLLGGGILAYCEFYEENRCPDRKVVSSRVRTVSHTPVVGVTVILDSDPTDPQRVTDTAGAFEFDNVPNADSAIFLLELKGAYYRYARKIDFCDEDGPITPGAIIVPDSLFVIPPVLPPPSSPGSTPGVRPPQTTEISLPIIMSGSVFDAVSKIPLQNVRVNGAGITVYTDRNGDFLLALPQEPDTKDILIKYRLEGYEDYSYRYYNYPKGDISTPLKKKPDPI